MLFTTLHWILFLFVIFTAFHLVGERARKWLLLGASLYFYASWSAPYLLLIGAQLAVDWSCGFLLARSDGRAALRAPGSAGWARVRRWRRLLLGASVTVNLGVLVLFKYAALFHLPLRLPLPLAISFYTFESMSYTIDVYRHRLAPLRSPLHLALFITWFPHLIAGPIIRPAELVPQLECTRPIDRQRFFSGATLMLIGYAKKLLIADWLARAVDPLFADPSAYSSLELLIGAYGYAFQIYCDFSAYTDIARGASRWFDIELPQNFADPYLATSVTDFWRRWHMTLSHWLRDYLYIPLGGNRRGRTRTYLNLMITMLLGGLWHGANWTFVVWGGLHGLFLAVERAIGGRVAPGRIVTFHLVCGTWIFFRAPSLDGARAIFAGLARGQLWVTPAHVAPMLAVIALIALYWMAVPLGRRLLSLQLADSWPHQLGWVAAVSLFVLTLMALGASSRAFIYFQF
jgi:D-alanyl-lipoteichoic acid acyltransferase DltB (MBOAT superfamily)